MRLFPALVLALLSGNVLAAPDEDILGKAEGFPICPPPQRFMTTPPQCLVGLFSNMDRYAPTHKVARSTATWAFKRAEIESDVYDFNGFLASNRSTGLLVIKGDTILIERYQYDRKPEHRFTSQSMAKTVVAMLVGIAVAEGRIQSIDDRAEKYVPELKGHPYGETPIRHLLTMSSGVRFIEDYSGADDVVLLGRKTFVGQGPGGFDTVITFNRRSRPPGETFYYASGESQVLALVLRAAVGKPVAEYLSEKIWQPMGAEFDADWVVDAGGNEVGFAGFNATLRDWGRLGMLLANGGARDGRPIIPEAWVKAATRPDADHLAPGRATRFLGYGYQTWIVPGVRTTFALRGVRGQSVFVDPAARLVAVHTAVHAGMRDPAVDNQFSMWNALLRNFDK